MAYKDRKQFSWTFRGFETPARNRPVRDWITALSPEARDELIDIILYMRVRPHNEWAGENFKALEDGISEIRFRDADFTYRVYGYFGPSWFSQSYTFLVGAAKKVKNDRDSKKLARERRDQIERGEATAHAFSFKE